MVHGMIGAVWEAIPQRHLNYAMGATCAYFGAILMTSRSDTKAAGPR